MVWWYWQILTERTDKVGICCPLRFKSCRVCFQLGKGCCNMWTSDVSDVWFMSFVPGQPWSSTHKVSRITIFNVKFLFSEHDMR